MARISKPAPQRRTEILDAAQQLFTTKGVQATSIEDILKQVGIAKEPSTTTSPPKRRSYAHLSPGPHSR